MSTSPTKKPRKRRTFAPEFEAEAVRLTSAANRSIRQVAQELGVPEHRLHAWAQQAAIDQGRGGSGALTTDERAELTRLRRELRVAQEECDFLRKAAAYFAKDPS